MQIREKEQRVIIIDKILNPIDGRSEKWTIWTECEEYHEFDDMAAALISTHSKDSFWTTFSQSILSVCAQKLKEENSMSFAELTNLTTIQNVEDIQFF